MPNKEQPEENEPKYSPEIRTLAYAMQSMSHKELCATIIDIDNKAHMVGFKNGKFAMQAHSKKQELRARREQIMQDFLSLCDEFDIDESKLIDWREAELTTLEGKKDTKE